MELGEFEMTNDAVFLQLKHPKTQKALKDENGPVGVEIFGADSAEFKKHRRRLQDKALEARQKRNAPIYTAEDIDTEAEKTLCACIRKIVNVSWKGKALEAPADTMTLIKEMPWAAEQIDQAMADRSLFMPALSKD